jgi:hypothetical protein
MTVSNAGFPNHGASMKCAAGFGACSTKLLLPGMTLRNEQLPLPV